MNKLIITDEIIIGKVFDIKEYCFKELEIAKKNDDEYAIDKINDTINEISNSKYDSDDLIEISNTPMDSIIINKLIREPKKVNEREAYIKRCLTESIKLYGIDLNNYNYSINDLIGIVDDYYLDTDIQISKICDIIIIHLNEIDDKDFDICDYVDDFY